MKRSTCSLSSLSNSCRFVSDSASDRTICLFLASAAEAAEAAKADEDEAEETIEDFCKRRNNNTHQP